LFLFLTFTKEIKMINGIRLQIFFSGMRKQIKFARFSLNNFSHLLFYT